MKKGSTFFLRGVLALLSLAPIGGIVYYWVDYATRIVPNNIQEPKNFGYFLFAAHLLVLPLLFAIYQAFKLLNYIDKNQTFSSQSVKALRNIKYCALTVIGIVVLSVASAFILIDGDIAGFISISGMFVFATTVVGTFAGLLEKLLQNAVEIKSENDLMV